MENGIKTERRGRKSKNWNPVTEREDKPLGKVEGKTREAFKDLTVKEAALSEMMEVFQEKLQARATEVVNQRQLLWDRVGKQFGINPQENILCIDFKTGEVFFIETQKEREVREASRNPLARLIAGR